MKSRSAVIEISRSLARQLWTVFRRCVRKPYGSHPPAVEFLAGADGLRVWVAHHEVAAECRQPDPRPADTLRLPMDALSAFAGRGEEVVTLEAAGPEKLLARWSDRGVPQAVEYESPDAASQPTFPPLPQSFVGNPPELIGALDEAAHTTAADATRYAMHRLLFRGRSGEVAATDGQQLLIHGGFNFGWPDDVLVSAVPVFGGKELGPDQPVDVGRTDEHVVLRVGAWTFWLRIDADGRFPSLEGVVPKPQEACCYLRIAPADATFLGTTLPRLPGRDDDHQPLTVDLNGRVCVRARAEGQSRTTEVVLARSECTGEPARLCLNRLYLARALRLGLADAYVVKPTSPVLFRDDHRQYVVMPLQPDGALPPADDALRIESAGDQPPIRIQQPERTEIPMSTPSTNGQENGQDNGHTAAAPAENSEAPDKTGISIGALIAEAQSLRDATREVYGRAGRLVTALQRHRRQSRLVASTLQSLRQLQQIGG
jgi:hypothetical protein